MSHLVNRKAQVQQILESIDRENISQFQKYSNALDKLREILPDYFETWLHSFRLTTKYQIEQFWPTFKRHVLQLEGIDSFGALMNLQHTKGESGASFILRVKEVLKTVEFDLDEKIVVALILSKLKAPYKHQTRNYFIDNFEQLEKAIVEIENRFFQVKDKCRKNRKRKFT